MVSEHSNSIDNRIGSSSFNLGTLLINDTAVGLTQVS